MRAHVFLAVPSPATHARALGPRMRLRSSSLATTAVAALRRRGCALLYLLLVAALPLSLLLPRYASQRARVQCPRSPSADVALSCLLLLTDVAAALSCCFLFLILRRFGCL